ncbi:MAG: hypothetical protein KKF57_08065, partial [Firmicutes bacterium]|nr:hypothetical protein [Bacillota bacterium]
MEKYSIFTKKQKKNYFDYYFPFPSTSSFSPKIYVFITEICRTFYYYRKQIYYVFINGALMILFL